MQETPRWDDTREGEGERDTVLHDNAGNRRSDTDYVW